MKKHRGDCNDLGPTADDSTRRHHHIRIPCGLSQFSLTVRFLPLWELILGFVNLFKPEEHRKQIVLFADAPLIGKIETLLEPQHGFETGDCFHG